MSLFDTKWKLNGQTIASLRISNVDVAYENQQPDELTWMDPLARFDDVLRWPYDTEIVLTYNGVVMFRGTVTNDPRTMEAGHEDINYRAQGPWNWLDEMPYVQSYAEVEDPEAPRISQGGVILGMGDDGDKITVHDAVVDIIGSAIGAGCPITIGVIEGLDYEVMFDRTIDQSHADALGRYLQAFAPSHVVWWDYTGLMPSFNCAPRATLTARTLVVRPENDPTGDGYAPLEGIKINPLYQLQASCVCLFFRREDVSNGQRRIVTTKQFTPADASPTQRRALTRTWELAGAVTDSQMNYLVQPVGTTAISPLLVSIPGTHIIDAGGTAAQFEAMSNFWKRKLPFLKQVGVEILGFRNASRELPEPITIIGEDGAPIESTEIDEACERELVTGAITGWMQTKKNIKAQYHKFTVECRYKAFTEDSTDGQEKKEMRAQIFSAIITATNAQTRINPPYSLLDSADDSYTPPETVPAGLSDRLFEAVGELQHDGDIPLLDVAVAYDIRPGNVLNLQDEKQPDWANMNALVQSSRRSIDRDRAAIKVGYAHQLGFDDLKDMWRSNKTRQVITATRKFNPDSNGQAASLTVFGPRNDVTAVDAPPVSGTAEAVTPAGAVATKEELVAKIKKFYTDKGILPAGGHWINIPVAGRGAYRAYIHTADSNLGGKWNTSFTMGTPEQTYWVTMQQLGIY